MAHTTSQSLSSESASIDSPQTSFDVESLVHMRGILRIALPLMIGAGLGAIQQCLDRYFLGHINVEALAASFPAMMISWVITCFFMHTGGYLGTFVSQHNGAQEHRLIGAMCWPALILVAIGSALSLATIPLLPWIVSCFNADAQVESNIVDLCTWYCFSACPALFSVLWGSFFAALGRVRLVMVLSCIAVVLNIFFNYALMFGRLGFPELGLIGVGIGTFIAHTSITLVYAYLFFEKKNRRSYYILSSFKEGVRRIGIFLKYTAPNGIREVMEASSWHFLFLTVGHFGTSDLAAANVFMGWYILFFAPLMGIIQALSIAVAHCIGADKHTYVPRVMAMSMRIGIGYAIIWSLIYIFAGPYMVDPFLQAGDANIDEIRSISIQLFLIGALWSIADALQLLLRATVNATGDVLWTLFVTPVIYCIFLIAPCWYLIKHQQTGAEDIFGIGHTEAAWYIAVIALTALSCAFYYRYKQGVWKTSSVRS